MSAKTFDVFVIGGGSGGLAAALRAARLGAKVALAEPGELGGTCVNVGCVPKKAMWFAADMAGRLALARCLGFDLPQHRPLDWAQFLAHRKRYIDGIHASYREQLQDKGVQLVPHRAALTRMPGQVRSADDQLHQAEHIVIATGGKPVRPPIDGAELAWVSDDMFALQQAPKRLAVIGGGYIAVEMAAMWQALGSQVTLLVREPRVLESFDAQVVQRLCQQLEQSGIALHTDVQFQAITDDDGRMQVVTAAQPFADFDGVLLATGRKPNTNGLGLDEAGVQLDDHGYIAIDAWQNTSRPNTYAVGDVTAQPQLTPHAIAAGRRLMDRLIGGYTDAQVDFAQIPTVVFAHPPIAKLGLTEAQAIAAHGEANIRTYTADFRPMLYGLAQCERRSLFKVVCAGSEQQVVGLHLVGEAADEILQGFATAMHMGMRLRDLRQTLAIHPSSAEEVVLV